jgi:hypothetical protein
MSATQDAHAGANGVYSGVPPGRYKCPWFRGLRTLLVCDHELFADTYSLAFVVMLGRGSSCRVVL